MPFALAGIAVIFIAFFGGPSAAREAYLTRGGRVFTVVMLLLYLALGVAVPAAVIAGRGEAVGATGPLRSEEPTAKEELGKELFIQNCKSCHTLAAVQAHGVTGPNLDDLGGLDKQRVLNAIKIGRHRLRPHAPGPPRGRGRRRRGHLRGRRGRPLSPAAAAKIGPLQASLHLARKHRAFPSDACARLLAWPRPSKPKPCYENGAWGTQMAGRPGANRKSA